MTLTLKTFIWLDHLVSFYHSDELRLGHSKNAALNSFENVVLGDESENIRTQLPPTGLTEEEQVAALVDQATDPNILGRTWVGWEPWM